MKMNANQLATFLTVMVQQKFPVLITGAPGIGKTAIVNQVAEALQADVIPVFASMSDPTDCKGLPANTGKGFADFLPFGFLHRLITATKLTICFLDDLGQAPLSVQNAFMQLIHARTDGNGQKISDFVVFIGATNRRQDKAGVTGISEPVKSRFHSIVELVIDNDAFIAWGIQNGIHTHVLAFQKARPELLHTFKPTLDIVNSSCPRTIHHLSDLVHLNLPAELEFPAYCGAVGEGYAVEFMAFRAAMQDFPPIAAILQNPKGAKVSDNPSICYAVSIALARKADDTNVDVIMQYMERLSPDFQGLFWHIALKENDQIANTSCFISWSVKNQGFVI